MIMYATYRLKKEKYCVCRLYPACLSYNLLKEICYCHATGVDHKQPLCGTYVPIVPSYTKHLDSYKQFGYLQSQLIIYKQELVITLLLALSLLI